MYKKKKDPYNFNLLVFLLIVPSLQKKTLTKKNYKKNANFLFYNKIRDTKKR